MRTSKLKNMGSVVACLKHILRDKETPNADETKRKENYISIDSNKIMTPKGQVKKATSIFRKMLPDKIRKNAVLGVEVMLTGSPEIFQDKNCSRSEYLNFCDKWVKKYFGKENFVCAVHHYDEKTPHSHVVIVPKDENGKLNCRKYLGGPQVMHDMQTDFANFMKENLPKLNLERGQEWSKAKHTNIKEFYKMVNEVGDEKALQQISKWNELQPAELEKIAKEIRSTNSKSLKEHNSKVTKRNQESYDKNGLLYFDKDKKSDYENGVAKPKKHR